ncbi:uncharacterized protein LOC124612792 [Schistocerca americana]|uniref:uncharacterized protein LOC124612792 n=1 Tax=Schistocerca americana TaxID=7009 RepID=UPI001F5026E6|nr:uncharacterized protein LOC124612792 [Schistocerca americana]XP_046997150.1 uncharacterized protein LOC124612792 [Schistocerca americana]XP_047115073.1 uncharacterized protein LOC124795206 [Schistocerca piceifrons]XP_047115074.1 uncharacterized protein LOC124795206 [Schistocerca piceifrons]XP_049961325.1 uncharacterized protein LOC126481542 [Schistocerca serialis cubense]XP_049961326.1 uncharacterized protein LOC126481542 [Schistocerca serialis cubense]
MSEENKKLLLSDVTCSWNVVNERQLNDAISFTTEASPERLKDLESVVSLETCVHLSAKDDLQPCILELRPEKLKIKSFVIVSEARIVEIYGNCGEYILTSHGDFFDECQDLVVFVIEVKLPQPSQECTIKFARTKDKEQMWLFGIHIFAENCTNLTPQNTINFQNVNNILKESGHQLSEKAEKYKKLLQLYGSCWDQNKSQMRPPNAQNLLKMFEVECLSQYNQIGAQAKNVTRCLTDILPSFNIRQKENPPAASSECAELNCSDVAVQHQSCDTITEDLKLYISEQCDVIEKRILSKVEEKLEELDRRQNQKLDKILCLLSKLDSNS